MTLGQRIRAARRARGITQKQLGGGTLSESFISMVEHDKVRPSLDTLQALADRLNVPASTLLDAVRPSRQAVEVELRRCEGFLRQHRFTDALEGFGRLGPLAERSDDPAIRVRCGLGMGQALAGTRQFDLAESHLRRALDEARRIGSAGLLGAAANALGFLHFRARKFAPARAVLEEAGAALHGIAEHRELLGKVLANLGRVYVELGLPAEAMRMYGDAEAALGATADPSHRALLHFNRGIAAEQQQAYEQARWHLDQALELFRLQENLHLLSVVQRSIGILRLQQGSAADALAPLEQSLHLARQTGDAEGMAQTMVELARAHIRTGAVARGRELAAEAAAVAARVADPLEAARAEFVLAEAALAERNASEAQTRLRAAVAAFEELGAGADLGRAQRALGESLLRSGRPAEAARHLARALDLITPGR